MVHLKQPEISDSVIEICVEPCVDLLKAGHDDCNNILTFNPEAEYSACVIRPCEHRHNDRSTLF